MTKSLRFEFVDLKLFSLVAEKGSISHAADLMPLALSAASARIKTLEERLGLTLFERKPRGVELTQAGKLFLDHAKGLLRAANEAQRGMEVLSGEGRIQLTLFSNTTGLSTDLPAMLGKFLEENPQIDINFEQRASKEVLKAVSSGGADLGIVDGDYNQRELLYLLFQRNQLVVIAHPNTELGKLESCRFKDLLNHPLVGYNSESSLQKFIERMSLLSHQSGSFRAKVPDFNSVANLVSANVGAAIVPKPLAERLKQRLNIKVIELNEPWANRELHVCIRPPDDKPMIQNSEQSLSALRLAKYLAGVD